MSRRVRRSGMTMPINNPRFVNRSWTRHCDFLNYDLEDSVPQAQKPHARTLVGDAIAIGQKGGADITLRINVAYPEADAAAGVLPGMRRINHTKTEHAEQIRNLDDIVTRLERERGLRPGTVGLFAMTETARGVANAYEYASASPRISTFGGIADYDIALDMGIDMFVGFDQLGYNRGECELVAYALGLEPRLTMYTGDTRGGSVSDAEGAYLKAVAFYKAGGRTGGGLHPNVVDPQNRGFTPTAEEVEQAQRTVAFYGELNQRGDVEGELDSKTVDVYEARRATELVEWADVCARKDTEKTRAREATIAREGLPEGMQR